MNSSCNFLLEARNGGISNLVNPCQCHVDQGIIQDFDFGGGKKIVGGSKFARSAKKNFLPPPLGGPKSLNATPNGGS